MNDFQNIKKLLIPLLKGSPIIIVCFIIALMLGYRSILYTNPVYESTVKIRLDDINNGVSSTNLFKDFDVFSLTNKIAAEVEVLKSKLLTEKALEKLDFGISYHRVGKMRTTELYHDSPFLVKYDKEDPHLAIIDRVVFIKVLSPTHFELSYNEEIMEKGGEFGKEVEFRGAKFTVVKNEELFLRKPKVDFEDLYQFRINSISYLADMLGGKLDVTAIDKDVAILRISCKSEIPEKSSLFVNTLAETYIEDYIENKTGAARKTVQFIDQQLVEHSKKLRDSEAEIERFRNQYNIINTRQETETDLRKISQLKIQLANMSMNVSALDSLHYYIETGNEHFLDLAPNFEAFTDLLSTELIKKIKFYQAERKDLLIKYTENEEKVKVIDRKIKDITSYLRESIKNTRNNLHIKQEKIEQAIKEAEDVFIGLPTKEKNMIILERNFRLNETIYNFLMEKRTEAAIAEAASIAFHRVIDKAVPPEMPISPKKTLIMIVCGMLGLIVSIVFIYVREFIGGKIRTRSELEKVVDQPVAGVIKKFAKNNESIGEDFQTLVSSLVIQDQVLKHQKMLITSTISGEGKTSVVENMAKAFSNLEWKVVVLDLNLRRPSLHNVFGKQNTAGVYDYVLGQVAFKDVVQSINENLDFICAGNELVTPLQLISSPKMKEKLDELAEDYDLVLLDSPAISINLDAVKLMDMCHYVYYLVRANFTKSQYLPQADMIAKEYDFKHMKMLLNGVHRATNYSGVFTGSRYNYKALGLSFFQKIKRYFRIYVRTN